jgi:hypothetical protein
MFGCYCSPHFGSIVPRRPEANLYGAVYHGLLARWNASPEVSQMTPKRRLGKFSSGI